MPHPPSPEVEQYLAALDHPLASVAWMLRASIRSVSPDVVESIKWKAPNFALADDFATLNLRRPTAVQVILHTGAKRKPSHPQIVIDDRAKLLAWSDRNRAIVTFTSEAQALDHQSAFIAIVRSWAAQLSPL